LRVTGGTSTIITISTKKTLFPQALKNYGLTFNPCLPLGGHKPGSIKKWSFGTFVNVVRKANIALANNLLSEEKNDQRMEDIQDSKQTWEKQDTLWNEIMDRIRKHSKFNCPVCKKGTMRFAGMVPPG
jgi:hypothetical protein